MTEITTLARKVSKQTSLPKYITRVETYHNVFWVDILPVYAQIAFSNSRQREMFGLIRILPS